MSAVIYLDGENSPDISVGRSVASSLLEDFCEYARENFDLTEEESAAVDALEWHPHGVDEPYRLKPAAATLLFNLTVRTGRNGGDMGEHIHGLYADDPFDPMPFKVEATRHGSLVYDRLDRFAAGFGGDFPTPYNVEGTGNMSPADFEAMADWASSDPRRQQDGLVHFIEGHHLPERCHHRIVRDLSEPEYGSMDGVFEALAGILAYSAVNGVDVLFSE